MIAILVIGTLCERFIPGVLSWNWILGALLPGASLAMPRPSTKLLVLFTIQFFSISIQIVSSSSNAFCFLSIGFLFALSISLLLTNLHEGNDLTQFLGSCCFPTFENTQLLVETSLCSLIWRSASELSASSKSFYSSPTACPNLSAVFMNPSIT